MTVHDPTHPRDLPGLISDAVGEALAMLATSVDPADAIVEIGSYRGKSAAYLAEGATQGNPPAGQRPTVYAVDPWDLQDEPGKHGYNAPEVRQDFVWNIEAAGYEIGKDVVPVQAYSGTAAVEWPEGQWIGLLFIDGDHTENGVIGDWSNWRQHLSNGAVVAFDDLDTRRNPGVRRAFDKILTANPELRLSGILAGRLGVIWT